MNNTPTLSEERMAYYGEELLDRYMRILSDPDAFVVDAYCEICKEALS